MSRLSEAFDFVSDILITMEAGAIVIAFWTFLISLFLLHTNSTSAVIGFQICTGAVVVGVIFNQIEQYLWHRTD